MLLRISAVILLLAIFSAGCIQKKPERLAKKESPVSSELMAMVAEQERARDSADLDAEAIAGLTGLTGLRQEHRHAVYRFVAKALIREPEDLYRAALLLQSADETTGPEICLQAHLLAAEAAEKGLEPAKFLAAASLDRYLVLVGGLQLYGTQYYNDDGILRLYPCDTTTTDSLRAVWGGPPLDSLKAEVEILNKR